MINWSLSGINIWYYKSSINEQSDKKRVKDVQQKVTRIRLKIIEEITLRI